MQKQEWLDDARFSTKAGRIANSAEVDQALQAFLRGKAQEEALSLLAQSGIPSAPIRTPMEAVKDEYPFERNAFAYVGGMEKPIPVTGDMWHFSRSEVQIGPLPRAGEHTRELLSTLLGYPESTIDELKRSGVVG
jgi:formyl-CoA transferase